MLLETYVNSSCFLVQVAMHRYYSAINQEMLRRYKIRHEVEKFIPRVVVSSNLYIPKLDKLPKLDGTLPTTALSLKSRDTTKARTKMLDEMSRKKNDG